MYTRETYGVPVPLPNAEGVSLFVRQNEISASRQHVLVLPSVVCSNAVAVRIAAAVGAVTVTHQHGCAQIGEDAQGTTEAFIRLARHPNTLATLVVSLGCESLQGVALTQHLQDSGLACGLVGIQDSGGSAHAIESGVAGCRAFDSLLTERRKSSSANIPLGVAFAGQTGHVARTYTVALADVGFDVRGPVNVSAEPVLALGDLAWREEVIGIVLVSDGLLPTGPALVPLLAVAATRELFLEAPEEYDLHAPSPELLIAACFAMLEGEKTLSEKRRDTYFAVRRSLLTL